MTDSILWRRLDLPGHEIACLQPTGAGWRLQGTAVFAYQRQACKIDYDIRCREDWCTASAQVNATIGSRTVDLLIVADANRNWHLNDRRCPGVAGCIDLDLGFSPSTNLLPIRRLALAVGEAAEVNAAWLPFPAMELAPLAQTYRRDEALRYHYESRGGRFARDLGVNQLGFVTDYPGLWQIEAGSK
jgi:hypothetical protein